MKKQSKLWLLMLAVFVQALPVYAATLEENLRAYVMPYVKTISPGREVHLYHWAPRSTVLAGKDQMTPIAVDDYRAKQYLGYLRDVEYGQMRGTGVRGGGIYAAIDPVISRPYGKDDFVLIQFVMRGGAKFLDLYNDNKILGQSIELVQQLRNIGCEATFLANVFVFPSCKTVRDFIVYATGVSALRYDYDSAEFKNCGTRSQAAFVLFGDEAINWNRISVFTKELPQWDDGYMENRLIIQQMFQLAESRMLPWPQLSSQKSRTDVPKWMKTNIMSCKGGFSEDK